MKMWHHPGRGQWAVKQLKLKEIENIISILRKIQDYKLERIYSWDCFLNADGHYLIKAEIIVIWKLCREIGLEIDFADLPKIYPEKEYDDFDNMYELEYVMDNFVFPDVNTMNEKGWEVFSIDEDDILKGQTIDRENCDIEKLIEEYCINTYGNFAHTLHDFVNFMHMVFIEEFVSYRPTLLKSKRVGRYLSHVDKHPGIKRSKQYDMIMYCLDAVLNPFEIYYPVFSGYVIADDGCCYSFTSGGEVQDSDGEVVSLIHCKIYRYLCLELVDQLLTRAEKRYNL